jgi:hypothetical protein
MPILCESSAELAGGAANSNMDVSEMVENHYSVVDASREDEEDGEEAKEEEKEAAAAAAAAIDPCDAGKGSRDREDMNPFSLAAAQWAGHGSSSEACFEIVKPIPIVPRPHRKAGSMTPLLPLSELMEPTPLSYRLLEEGSRHSAFQTTSSSSSSSSSSSAAAAAAAMAAANSGSSASASGRELDGQASLTRARSISVP